MIRRDGMEFIKTDHNCFTYQGIPIRLRGFGIGTWLNLEHFMIGLPTPDEMIQRTFEDTYGKTKADMFFQTYQTVFMEEEDFQYLKQCGVNFIRVPFNYRLFIDDNHTEEYKEFGFALFDRLFALCRKYQIFVLLDLHTTPGGQNPDWHSDNSNGVPLFWKYQVFRDQMTNLWKEIAFRYHREPFLMGYDLINEPAMGNWDLLNEFYEKTVVAIRQVDGNHIIVLEGEKFSMDFSGLNPIEDPLIALSFHYYPTVWHPDLLDLKMDRFVRKEKIKEGLDRLLAIQETFGYPAFCGEFGYGKDCGSQEFTTLLLEDTLELLEQRDVNWLLWCYKDAHFMSLVSPKKSLQWMKLVDVIENRWSQEIEKAEANHLLDVIKERYYPLMTEEERYLLQFRFRACLYLLQKEYVLRPELDKITAQEIILMAREFSFENCEINVELETIMKHTLRVPIWEESLPSEERIECLIKELSLDEKLRFLTVHGPQIARLGMSAFSLGGEAAHGVEARRDQAFNFGEPVPTTVFTQPIGLSATWDENAIEQAGYVTGMEARAIFNGDGQIGLSRWAPTVDMERDPRWGRTEEGYGEDPYLVGKMASAYIKGMQGTHSKYLLCAATLKHFYANNVEVGREYSSSSLDSRNKYEYYLESFQRAIMEGKAEAVMTSYNEINGIPAIVNPEVTELLKEKWGLKGHVVCDMGDLEQTKDAHHYVEDDVEALSLAIDAGVDAFNDSDDYVIDTAKEALRRGRIKEEQIDNALRRTFATKFRLGLYDSKGCPYHAVGEDVLNCKEHQAICLDVAKKSVVLLKNEMILPLDKECIERLGVVGPLAAEWLQDWYAGNPPYTVTPLDGIRKEFKNTIIQYSSGLDIVKIGVTGKFLAIDEQGTCYLSNERDATLFEHGEWEDNRHTFRTVSDGRYLVADFERKTLVVKRDKIFSWFVDEAFELEGKEGNLTYIKLWNQQYVTLSPNGAITFSDEDRIAMMLKVVHSALESIEEIANESDTIIVVLGGHPIVSCKEGVDRKNLKLPVQQERLLQHIYKKTPKIIMVLIANYPYDISWAKEHIPAIIMTASGSQELGTAIAAVVSGSYSPAGRLSMTWYQDCRQLPDLNEYDIIHGKRTYQYFDGNEVYPFGYGLSYTNYNYSQLAVHKYGTKYLVELAVKNIGNRDGDEVVQLYVRQLTSRTIRPKKQLKGFQRIHLKEGEERTLCFSIPMKELEYFNVVTGRMVLEAGRYEIQVGASSSEIRQRTWIEVDGEKIQTRDVTQPILGEYYDWQENMELGVGEGGIPSIAPRYRKEKETNRERGSAIYNDVLFHKLPTCMILRVWAKEQGIVWISLGEDLQIERTIEWTDGFEEVPIMLQGSGNILGKRLAVRLDLEGKLAVIWFSFDV